MKNSKWTTWEGQVEWNMDYSSVKILTCLAKSYKGALGELKRLAKKVEGYNGGNIHITNVKISKRDGVGESSI